MTFSTGHVRLWEKEAFGHRTRTKPLPLGKMPKMSEVYCKAVKFLALEDSILRTQTTAWNQNRFLKTIKFQDNYFPAFIRIHAKFPG